MDEVRDVAARTDRASIERLIDLFVGTRKRQGRVFVLGVGGSAGNASHAVNDFRKLCDFEAYAPTDGWETAFACWLRRSRLGARDMVCVFSVGGGDAERNVSVNLIRALDYARSVGAGIGAIVGRDGGYTAKVADACVIVPTVNPETVTAHTEAFQAVIWHLLVSHPRLKTASTKWESLTT